MLAYMSKGHPNTTQPNKTTHSTDSGQFFRQPVEWRLDQIIAEIDAGHNGLVTVAFMDIDRYSQVEWDHGYGLADALLKAIEAEMLKAAQATFAGRYVRDSFMVLYRDLSFEDAFLEAERLRAQLSSTAFHLQSGAEQCEVTVTLSCGVSSYPGDPENRSALVTLAEEACRRAFEGGGNRTALARPVNMVPKTSHYLPAQLERLRELAQQMNLAEAALLREALDDLLRKYDQRVARRGLARLLNRQPETSAEMKAAPQHGKK